MANHRPHPPALESSIERQFVYHCKSRGLLCYKFTSPAHSGVPDRVIIGPGKALFLELKRVGKEPNKLQDYEINRINRTAGREGPVAANWSDSIEQAKMIVDMHFFPI